MASGPIGGASTKWAPEYTYSATYHKPAFDAPAVAALITGFQADPAAQSAASRAYLRNYFPGDISSIIQFAWPQYACSMDHDSGKSFAACVCPAPGQTGKVERGPANAPQGSVHESVARPSQSSDARIPN
jgi:hypothetical protein